MWRSVVIDYGVVDSRGDYDDVRDFYCINLADP